MDINGCKSIVKVQTGGNVCSQGEKFTTVKLVRSWFADIRCCSLMLCCVTRLSGLHQGVHCYLNIYTAITTGGLLDSSLPQSFLLTFFFFLRKNISSFATNYRKGSLEKPKSGKSQNIFFWYMFLDVKLLYMSDCESAT